MSKELRVYGPPGTGKTTYLSKQISIAAQKYGSDAVMAASFTKAAAVELISRDLPVNRDNVGTLHALCYRALGFPKIAETKLVEFNGSQSVYQLSGGRIDMDEPDQIYDNETDILFARYQIFRSQMTPRVQWPIDILGFAKAWEGWKYESDYIDFTDMIEMAIEREIPPPGNSSVGFFDESQDFTKLELQLVRMWGTQLEYTVIVGDDDQCIYGFKGANAEAFLQPELPEDQTRVLTQSYRLPAIVHKFSDTWVRQLRVRKEKLFNPRDSEGLIAHRKDLSFKSPETIVDLLEEFQEIDPEQTTMIIGACSYQIQPIVQELKKRSMLYHNPYRRKRGDWNPIGYTARDGSMISSATRLEAYLKFPWTYSDVRLWSPLVKRKSVFSTGKYDQIVPGPAGEDYLSDTAMDLLFCYGVVKEIRNKPLEWIANHAATTKKDVLSYPLGIIEKYGIEKLHERPTICVGTIHSVKGGEADTVILLPDLSPAGMRQWASDRDRQHIVRQMYVGITRARERLILCNQSSPTAVRWPVIS